MTKTWWLTSFGVALTALSIACGDDDSDAGATGSAGASGTGTAAGSGGASAGAAGSSAAGAAGSSAAGAAGSGTLPLVGKWKVTHAAPAPAIDTASQFWEFKADGKATRIDVMKYNAMVSEDGCTQTNTFTDFVWAAKGADLTVDGGNMSSEFVGCKDPKLNQPPSTPMPSMLMMTGTWSVVGDKLTLTLQGTTDVLTAVP